MRKESLEVILAGAKMTMVLLVDVRNIPCYIFIVPLGERRHLTNGDSSNRHEFSTATLDKERECAHVNI